MCWAVAEKELESHQVPGVWILWLVITGMAEERVEIDHVFAEKYWEISRYISPPNS